MAHLRLRCIWDLEALDELDPEWEQIGRNTFVRGPHSRGWVHEYDLSHEQRTALDERIGRRSGILHPDAWTLRRLASLVVASLILMVGSFVALMQFGRPPSNSVYEPAHIDDGKFVPQKYR